MSPAGADGRCGRLPALPMSATRSPGPGVIERGLLHAGCAEERASRSRGVRPPLRLTIDQAVATVPAGSLLIAKIDIEGFESDLFDGDLRWMDDVHVIFLEPHDWMLPGRRTSRSFQAALGQRDFELFLSGENLIYVRRE